MYTREIRVNKSEKWTFTIYYWHDCMYVYTFNFIHLTLILNGRLLNTKAELELICIHNFLPAIVNNVRQNKTTSCTVTIDSHVIKFLTCKVTHSTPLQTESDTHIWFNNRLLMDISIFEKQRHWMDVLLFILCKCKTFCSETVLPVV
jgi:hypothetical protein